MVFLLLDVMQLNCHHQTLRYSLEIWTRGQGQDLDLFLYSNKNCWMDG